MKHQPLHGASPADRPEAAARRDGAPRPALHGPLATPEAIAHEPAPFPAKTAEAPEETGFPDWRRRLTGNLSRRSDGRWAPLTWTHPIQPPPGLPTH